MRTVLTTRARRSATGQSTFGKCPYRILRPGSAGTPVGDSCVKHSASRNNSGWLSFKVKAQSRPSSSTALTIEILEQRQGAAYLDAIDRRHHQASGPVGTENSVAFQAAGDFATERGHRFRRLSLQRVAEGVVADRPMRLANAPLQHSASTWSKLGICMAAPRKTASKTFFPGCCGNCRPSGRALTSAEKPNTLSR
jgi:hypothetical protein